MKLGNRRTFACVRPHTLARRALLAAAAALLLATGPSTAPPQVPATAASASTAAAATTRPAGEQLVNLRPEVRLRKLHLVRPDLIQYPLQYDIIC